jgi:F-type H+-transporting ATPase subunit a
MQSKGMSMLRTSGLAALLLGALLAGLAMPAQAAESEGGDPNAIGHSADGFYMDFSPVGVIELPRLLLVRGPDGNLGFEAFASTHAAVEYGGYTLVDGEGFPLSTPEIEEAIIAHEHLYYTLTPQEGEIVLDLSVTRQQVWVIICAIILLVIGLRLAGRYKRGLGRDEAPRGAWQNMMESLIVFIREDIAKPSIGHKYRRYLPYLLSVFIFILLGNLLGLVPWGVTATSNIMVTGGLAFITFLLTQFAGTKDYWKHIFWPPDVPVPIKFILIPVEVMGMFTKPLALAFRLFGNMVSGHLVIVSLLGLIFIFAARLGTGIGIGMILVSVPLTIFIYLLKMVVSLVQAYIFTMLSAVFIGMAAADHEHHEPHEAVVPEPAPSSELPAGPGMEELLQGGDGHQQNVPQPSMAS